MALVDLSDLVTFVMSELKYQSTDAASETRIIQDINAVYINEVVPFKRWNWLSGHTTLSHKGYYSTGTVTVTPDSTTVTLSTAPSTISGSRAGYLFSVEGFDEIYTISAHTAGSATLTLSSSYTGALSSTATFKIWNDTLALPTDCRETVEVWTDFHRATMEPLGLQEFRRRVRSSPKTAEKPVYYTTYDYSGTVESSRYRQLKVHPSLFQDNISIHVDYVKEVSELTADGDEPEMPIEDRIVLAYGALYRAWTRERNPEAAMGNRQLFNEKLARMAGKIEDGFDKPQLIPDNLYVSKKRGPRSRTRRVGQGGGSSGGTYSSPTYIANAQLATGNYLTGDLTVSSGVTIDGVDISVLSTAVDALSTLADGTIYVGNASNVATEVTMSGDVTITNAGVAAISSGVIVNADISASAAVALTKLATTTASRALVSDSSGVITPATTTATEIGYVNGVTSAIQTQLNLKAPLASPTFSGTITTPLTASRALVTGASSELAAATTTATEIGYVNGVTSAIQTQINTKATGPASSTDNAIARFDSTTGKLLQDSTVTVGDTGAISNVLTGDVVGLKIQKAAGATANLTEWYDSSPSLRAYVTTNGTINTAGDLFANRLVLPITLSGDVYAGMGTKYSGRNGTTYSLGTFGFVSNAAASPALAAKGSSSQSADIFKVINDSDVTLAYARSNGTWQADSGLGAKRTATATSYTVLITDYFIGVTSNASARTITLPAASTCTAGQMFVIKDEAGTAASANNITIARAGSDTIDGATTITISANYGVCRLYSDGSAAWFSY